MFEPQTTPTLTLEEAKQELQSWLDEQRIFPNSNLANALKLGIRAQERICAGRATFDEYYATLLSGEKPD